MEDQADRQETTKNEHSIANCGIKDIGVVVGLEIGLEFLLYPFLRPLLKNLVITGAIDCSLRFGILYLWVIKHRGVNFSELGFSSARRRIGLGVLVGASVLFFYYLILGASMYPAAQLDFRFLHSNVIRLLPVLLLWMVPIVLCQELVDKFGGNLVIYLLNQSWR